MRWFFRNVIAIVACYVVAAPVVVFYLIDRIGTGLIAVSSWAVARRSWSDRLFTIIDRIEAWQIRED